MNKSTNKPPRFSDRKGLAGPFTGKAGRLMFCNGRRWFGPSNAIGRSKSGRFVEVLAADGLGIAPLTH